MNKLIFTGIMTLSVMILFAQPGPSEKNPEEMATRMTARMNESLQLTEDQKDEVYQINLAFATKMKQADESVKQLRQKHHENLALVLTEDQMQQLQANFAKRQKMYRHKAHERETEREELQRD